MLKKLIGWLVCLALLNYSLGESLDAPPQGSLSGKAPLPIDLENEIQPVAEFPIEVDLLNEFIQSYYALLDSDEYLKGFPFLRLDENYIPDSDRLLGNFLYELMELRSGIRDKVTIYQIGDSHIKPGFFSTTVRSSLIRYFESGEMVDSPILSYQFTGIIGASFLNQLSNEAIFRRCRELQPDLIVISLGTNDAQGTFNAERFRGELRAFMNKLKRYQSSAAIIFTLPPDTNKYGRHNADVAKVSAEIVAYADEQGYAHWDLAAVMGGRGSIGKWRAKDLASKDLIHFSPQGYMLQGHLFYQALMRAYKSRTDNAR